MGDRMSAFEVVSGVPVVAAPEEIDITNAGALRSAVLEAAAYGHGTLVVDMTVTRFCDSSGIHTLLAAHQRVQPEGGGAAAGHPRHCSQSVVPCADIRTRSEQSVTSGASLPAVRVSPQRREAVHPRGSQPGSHSAGPLDSGYRLRSTTTGRR